MKEFFFPEKGLFARANDFDKNKKTLFFIHGISGSSSAWLSYEVELENDYNIISFDFRGHGKSARYNKKELYKMELFSAEMKYILDIFNCDKCFLIAHSFGVFPTLDFIAKNKEMVSGVVFVSPYYSLSDMENAWFVKKIFSLGASLSDFIVSVNEVFFKLFNKNIINFKKTGSHIDYSKHKGSGDWNLKRMIADLKNTGMKNYLFSIKNAYDFNGKSILDEINFPVVMVHGDKDTIIPLKYAISMSKKISNVKFFILKDTDHIIVLNKKDDLLKIIKDFLENFK